MTHPHPPHLPAFDYTGKHTYFLTFSTQYRRTLFLQADLVEEVRSQFLRACRQLSIELTAYCFMPDHVHLLLDSTTDGSDVRKWIKLAKQLSGYLFAQAHSGRLWQRYGYERVIGDDVERALTIRYIVENPVKAGLAGCPQEYPFLGSERYTVEELTAQAGLQEAAQSEHGDSVASAFGRKDTQLEEPGAVDSSV